MKNKLMGSKWSAAPSKFQREEKKETVKPFKIIAGEEFEKNSASEGKKLI